MIFNYIEKKWDWTEGQDEYLSYYIIINYNYKSFLDKKQM